MEIVGRKRLEIDISNLGSGLYILHLKGEERSIHKTVIVQ
jgi:hypothetical protein